MYGNNYIYSGGGYIAILPEELTDAKTEIERLKSLDWINLYTRAIVVEFSTYNANINLFSNVMLLFEIPPSGGVLTLFFIETFRVYHNVGTNANVILMCELVVLGIVIYFTVIVCKAMRKQRREFFKKLNNWVELTQTVIAYMAFVTFISQQLLTSDAVTAVFEAKGKIISQTIILVMLSALREEFSQTNVILSYRLLAAMLSAVCSVIQQS